ncbi:MAG: helix-turn-helix transcriptional regulator [Magnetococcales bacterium]|nr:helix-turn-helix transcriptional regulator [Magnetococcales bacterium]
MTTKSDRNQNAEIAARFMSARRYAMLTQKALAEKVGVSQAAIHKMENGQFRTSRNTVLVAMACNINPIWLETGQGEMVATSDPKETKGPIDPNTSLYLNTLQKKLDLTIRELLEIKIQIQHLIDTHS